jgi:hypothetical protein
VNANFSLAVLNFSGGEIILILVLLFVLVLMAGGFFGLIYLIVRAITNRPPPVISTLPPQVLIQNQRTKDQEHLRLLSIFHFVVSGLTLFGIAFLCVHYFMMHTIFSNPDAWKGQNAPPKGFLDAFIWFYVFMGVILLTASVLNLLSGLFLRQKKHRTFSVVIAAINCIQIPIGTALGIFTIVVLSRETVRQLYCGKTV